MTPGSCRSVPDVPRHPGEQCCVQSFAREKLALYTLRARCALYVVRVGKRVATCLCRHFCFLRGLTPATHLILWRYRWFRPRRPVITPRRARTSRLSLPKNPVRQRDRCDVCYPRLPSGRFVDPPRPAIAACVSCRAGVERSPPVHKSADTSISSCSVRDTYEGAHPSRMSAHKTARNGPAVSGEVGGNHARRGARG